MRPRERERAGLRCIGSKRLGKVTFGREGGGEGTSVNKAGHRQSEALAAVDLAADLSSASALMERPEACQR